MCAAAISQARIRRLYFGTDDLKYGSINGSINYFQKNNTNHLPEIYDNICSDSCNRLLTNFFKEQRRI
jgi:tRNA(Arg) A34 adenosine deaminase TadA